MAALLRPGAIALTPLGGDQIAISAMISGKIGPLPKRYQLNQLSNKE